MLDREDFEKKNKNATKFQHVLRIFAVVLIQACKSANVTLNCFANVTQLDSKSVNVAQSWFANVTQQQCTTTANNPFIAKAKLKTGKSTIVSPFMDTILHIYSVHENGLNRFSRQKKFRSWSPKLKRASPH